MGRSGPSVNANVEEKTVRRLMGIIRCGCVHVCGCGGGGLCACVSWIFCHSARAWTLTAGSVARERGGPSLLCCCCVFVVPWLSLCVAAGWSRLCCRLPLLLLLLLLSVFVVG